VRDDKGASANQSTLSIGRPGECRISSTKRQQTGQRRKDFWARGVEPGTERGKKFGPALAVKDICLKWGRFHNLFLNSSRTQKKGLSLGTIGAGGGWGKKHHGTQYREKKKLLA